MKVLHIGKKGNVERFSDKSIIPENMELVDMPINLEADEYIREFPDAEHIIVDAIGDVNGKLIRGMSKLKSIHSEGVAYNRIDVETAKECGVSVCHSVGMNATAVAEQAVLLMLGMIKNFINNDRAVRTGHQIETKESYMINSNLLELADCSIGLIGFGNIAKATALIIKAFGVKDIYYNKRNRLTDEEEAKYGVEYKPLDELLRVSDIVSMHVPVTEDTKEMANAKFFDMIKEGAFFVNTARGELVDDKALADALANGKLTMAGFDTLSNEPVKESHYLLNRDDIQDKLIISPHIGGITTSSFRRSYRMIWEDIRCVRRGEIPDRQV